MKKKRELFLFEWVVVDNCNLYCDYCVNKGEFSHKSNQSILYKPGKEKEIAQKISDLSCLADKVVVNLTGGEPLLARYIEDVLKILSATGNVYIHLITNLKLLGRY